MVREDKRLLTVLFPDGRDGRAFTLKVHMLTFLLNSLMHSSKPKSLIMSLMILLRALLCLVSFYIECLLFLIYRQKVLKTCSSGKHHWKKLLHKLQMQLL